MLRGVKRIGAQFAFTMAACDLAWLPKLLAARDQGGAHPGMPNPGSGPPSSACQGKLLRLLTGLLTFAASAGGAAAGSQRPSPL